MLFWWSIFSSDDTNLNLSYACNVKNLNFFSHSSHSMAIDGTGLPVYSHKNSKSHVYCPSMIWVGDSLRSTLNLPNHEMSSILQMSTRLGSSWFTTKEKGRFHFQYVRDKLSTTTVIICHFILLFPRVTAVHTIANTWSIEMIFSRYWNTKAVWIFFFLIIYVKTNEGFFSYYLSKPEAY